MNRPNLTLCTSLLALTALALPLAASAQSGGPDSSGTIFAPAVYDWVPLSTEGGATMYALTDDSQTAPIDIALATGWASGGFNHYGVVYPSVVIDSNGKLNFDPLALWDRNNVCLPGTLSGPGDQPDIALYWDDLNPGATGSGSVYSFYDAVDDRFIISFEDVYHFSGTDGISVQAHLYEDGIVELHFNDTVTGDTADFYGAEATIGIQDYTGGTHTTGNNLEWSCDTANPLMDGTATVFTVCVDLDSDGDYDVACGGSDCDDNDPTSYTGNVELCDGGVDNDCDPSTDENVDTDGDGQSACAGDCDDGEALVYTGNTEVCDNLDNDCLNGIDDGFDVDMDTWSTCENDCDDNNATVYPGAPEACDGVDQNCDGQLVTVDDMPVPPTIVSTSSNILRGSRWGVTQTTTLNTIEALIGAPTGSGVTWGVFEGTSATGPWTVVQAIPTQTTLPPGDVWHSSPQFNLTLQAGMYYAMVVAWNGPSLSYNYGSGGTLPSPASMGSYEGSVTGSGSTFTASNSSTVYHVRITTNAEVDNDGDSFLACNDCNDSEPLVNASATEICDTFDNDCDGVLYVDPVTGEGEDDFDNDGDPECGTDCNDLEPTIFGGAPELCDQLDNDCDGTVPADESTDVDSDLSVACDDCNDGDATIFPGAAEACNGIDENCDGLLVAVDVPPVLPNIDLTSTNILRGSRWTPSSGQYLDSIQAYIDAPTGSAIEWRVYEGPSPTGPWTNILTIGDTTVEPAGVTFHNSPTVGITMLAGMTYATTVSWNGPSIGYYYASGPPLPAPALVGAYEGGVSGSGSSTTISTSTLAYTVGITTGSEDDADADTYFACLDDCDDNNAAVNPAGTEVCDGADNDCDGVLFVDPVTGADELDLDGDGGVACGTDCDDTDPTVLVGGTELCDGIDNDCNGTADFPGELIDADSDGSVACDDCDDATPTIFPGATELCNGIDDNCDGLLVAVDVPPPPTIVSTSTNLLRGSRWTPTTNTFMNQITTYIDAPTGSAIEWRIYEGATPTGPWTLLQQIPDVTTLPPGDAWHESPQLNFQMLAGMTYIGSASWNGPSISYNYTSDGGAVPLPASFGLYEGSVTGSGSTLTVSTSSTKYTVGIVTGSETDNDGDTYLGCGVDCDDDNAAVNPGAIEVCDGSDNDCDGVLFVDSVTGADESDADGDLALACAGDCDDFDATVFTGNPEICDGFDNDCNGAADFAGELVDGDSDGSVSCNDCDDSDPTILPGAPEICNGIDDDCDGLLTVIDSPPVPDLSGSSTNLMRGSRWSATQSTFLSTIEAYLPAPTGSAIEWRVYEATGPTGPFTLVQTVPDTTTLPAGVDWHVSPPINFVMQAGMTYGTTVSWNGPSIGYNWTNTGGSLPAPASFGTYEGGLTGSGSTTTASTSTAQYSIRISTGGEGDLDSDTYLACFDDCDDNDATVNPGVTEICGDGIDNDCDGVDASAADADGDGFDTCSGDCDDTDPATFPNATEVCDGNDNDCDGTVPANEADGDSDLVLLCDGDCDDADATVYPGNVEVCDGLDNDCDTVVPADELDGDGDGLSECAGDCVDTDPAIPAASEVCDGLDSDCNGVIPAGEADSDGDGVPVCASDCDDNDAANYPGNTEICDGQDNDCDATTEAAGEGTDADLDGAPGCIDCDDNDAANYPGNVEICDGQDNDCDTGTDETIDFDGDGFTSCDLDCNDADPDIYPGAEEVCDAGVDNDCDAATDEDADTDADGESICDGDCDDDNDLVNTTATEICDGEDNDCDGSAGADEVDGDGDGVLVCDGDCDDDDATVYTGAPELCDGIDNDCDGAVENDVDEDADGLSTCDGDCDDANADVYDGAPEICDGLDNNCDEQLPADEVDEDVDGVLICEGDCDDTEPTAFPGGDEASNCDDLIDNDCDGDTDGQDADCDGGDDDDSAGDDDDATGDDDDATGDDDDSGGDDDDATDCACQSDMTDGGAPMGLAVLTLLLGGLGLRRRRE